MEMEEINYLYLYLYLYLYMCSILYTQTDTSLHFALFHAAVLHIMYVLLCTPPKVCRKIFALEENSFVTVLMFCEKASAAADEYSLQFVRT